MRRGTVGRRMCLPLRAQSMRLCWGKSRMRNPADFHGRSFNVKRLNHEGHEGTRRKTWNGSRVRLLALSGFAGVFFALLFPLLSCSNKPDPDTLVMLIESSPTNLDPRVGVDGQSENIDSLIFDDLLSRGNDLNVAPGLADSWDIPDPLTYVFHLRSGVKFHDGRPLTSRDVKWTFDSLQNGTIRSTKTSTYRFVDHIDAPDDLT